MHRQSSNCEKGGLNCSFKQVLNQNFLLCLHWSILSVLSYSFLALSHQAINWFLVSCHIGSKKTHSGSPKLCRFYQKFIPILHEKYEVKAPKMLVQAYCSRFSYAAFVRSLIGSLLEGLINLLINVDYGTY